MKFFLGLSLLASVSAFNMAGSRMLSKSISSAQGLRTPTQLAASSQEPHGGALMDSMLADADKQAAIDSCDFSLELSDRQLCDVELLMQGGFSPLSGFMDENDYTSVVDNMSLDSGLIFGLPIVFDTDDERVQPGKKILLTSQGVNIATFEVSSRYTPNKVKEAKECYGSTSIEHPAVLMISTERGRDYCGGKISGLTVPTRDFPCKSPAEVRAELPEGADIVAFQCRNPIHRAHYELFTRALDAPEVNSENAVVLVHPTCGPTQADDIPGTVRYKTYEVLKEQVNNPKINWAYLPYSMHMAGPREAIQHMVIRKNYGCTHFIIGRDMAGCKSSLDGEDFYGAYDAQNIAKENAAKLGVTAVPSLNLVYTEEADYTTAEEASDKGYTIKKLSGTKFRKMLRGGEEIPEWFAFKSVVDVLRSAQ